MNQNIVTEEDLSVNIKDLIEELRAVNQPRLWDAQDIADYMKLAKATVQSHVLCKPDFPRAIKVTNGRRWEPEEVIKWAKSKREAA